LLADDEQVITSVAAGAPIGESRDVNEARSGRGRAEAKIALIFSQILHFDSISSKKEIFGQFSTELQKFWLKTGFNMCIY